MANRYFTCLLLSLLLLTACQPEVVLVDVTRLVEITRVDVTPPVSVQSVGQATPITVEVTRVVSQEVTRVVTATVVEESILEEAESPLGTADRPVQLLFAPVADTATIVRRGQVLAEALSKATGLNYEVGVLDGEDSLIQLMCAAPGDTVGFTSAFGYVLANEQCGVQAGNVAVLPDGLTWQAGMIVASRDSGITTLQDLAGKRWAVPDGSITRSLYFRAMFVDAGIELAEIVEVPGDNSALLAVYNREVDFATATYMPPILPFEDRQWEYGVDSPEIWRRVGISPRRSPLGYVLVNGEPEFGGYRLRDARSGIIDIAPEVYDETFIVSLSAQVPNDTVVFGASFPLAMARQVISALVDIVASDECVASLCSTDFFGWLGLKPAEAEAYEPLRFVVETLNLTAADDSAP